MHVYMHICMYVCGHTCIYVVQTNLPIMCHLWKGFMAGSLGICDKSDPTYVTKLCISLLTSVIMETDLSADLFALWLMFSFVF